MIFRKPIFSLQAPAQNQLSKAVISLYYEENGVIFFEMDAKGKKTPPHTIIKYYLVDRTTLNNNKFQMERSVRELTQADVNLVIDYFLKSSPQYLTAMGVDINRLPAKEEWSKIILDDLQQPLEHKRCYYLIWQINNKAVGHSNINDIIFGEEAYMHIHLWNSVNRRKGDGTYFIKESLFYYFQKFKIQKLFCQPYALNIAPNKALQHVGFEFIKKYGTIPGWLNFKQSVNLWVMDSSRYYEQAAQGRTPPI